jgi:hypothetical protein
LNVAKDFTYRRLLLDRDDFQNRFTMVGYDQLPAIGFLLTENLQHFRFQLAF